MPQHLREVVERDDVLTLAWHDQPHQETRWMAWRARFLLIDLSPALPVINGADDADRRGSEPGGDEPLVEAFRGGRIDFRVIIQFIIPTRRDLVRTCAGPQLCPAHRHPPRNVAMPLPGRNPHNQDQEYQGRRWTISAGTARGSARLRGICDDTSLYRLSARSLHARAGGSSHAVERGVAIERRRERPNLNEQDALIGLVIYAHVRARSRDIARPPDMWSRILRTAMTPLIARRRYHTPTTVGSRASTAYASGHAIRTASLSLCDALYTVRCDFRLLLAPCGRSAARRRDRWTSTPSGRARGGDSPAADVPLPAHNNRAMRLLARSSPRRFPTSYDVGQKDERASASHACRDEPLDERGS